MIAKHIVKQILLDNRQGEERLQIVHRTVTNNLVERERAFLALMLALATVVMMVSCHQPQWKQMQDQAANAEPSILNADELAQVLKADTTHFKAIYFFSHLCKPCQEHLRNEMLRMYQTCDTHVWKIYLVAEFNGLHRMVDDSKGDWVEAPLADNIRYYAKQYRTKLTGLGYDMNDVLFFYDARWDLDQGADQAEVVKSAFASDQPYELDNRIPLLILADPQNHVKTTLVVSREVVRVENGAPVLGPINTRYTPDCSDYQLVTFDYTHHDTTFSVGSRFRYDNSRRPPFDEMFKDWENQAKQ